MNIFYYMLFLIPVSAAVFYVYLRALHVYKRYARKEIGFNICGAELARRMLDANGLEDVTVELIPGKFGDYFDPDYRALRLCSETYKGKNVLALGIAAHEVAHAIQGETEHHGFRIRNGIRPITYFGSVLIFPLLVLGLLIPKAFFLVHVSLACLALYLGFYTFTLPIEFGASKKAVRLLTDEGILSDEELKDVRKVLKTASLSYVVTAYVLLFKIHGFALAKAREIITP